MILPPFNGQAGGIWRDLRMGDFTFTEKSTMIVDITKRASAISAVAGLI